MANDAKTTYEQRRKDALRLAKLAVAVLELDHPSPNWAHAGDMAAIRADLWDAIAPFGVDDGDRLLDARDGWGEAIDEVEAGLRHNFPIDDNEVA